MAIQHRIAPSTHPGIRPEASRHLRGRFTLVELLVVIAIIAVISAILLPALGAAREKAKQSLCTANLRQLSIAAASYGDDNEQMESPHWDWQPGGANNGYYLGITTPRQYPVLSFGGYSKLIKTGAGRFFPDYIPSPEPYYCPGNETTYEKKNTASPTGLDPARSFTMNADMKEPYHNGLRHTATLGGYFPISYAYAPVIDDLAKQRASRGDTPNGNYYNWYRTFGGYELAPNPVNMHSNRQTMAYAETIRNAEDGRPRYWDTSYGPYSLGDGSQITILNHRLRFGQVAYYDGHVEIYPHARTIYYTRRYSYGYNGFTSQYAVQILRRFGNGDQNAM